MKRLFSLKDKVTKDKVFLLDLGGAEIQSQENFKQRSKFGVMISFIIYIIILFYVIVTIIQFSKGVPTVIYSSRLPSTYEATQTLPLGIMFRNATNGDYYDPSIATVQYTYVTITNQDSSPRIKEPIDSVPCEFTEDSGDVQRRQGGSSSTRLLTEKAICPSKSVEMLGTFEMPSYKYLEAKVLKCSCTNISCPIQCASSAVFDDVFYGGSISVVMTELIPTSNPLMNKFSLVPSVNLAQPPVPINSTKSVFWKNLKAFNYNVDIYIRKQTIFNGPRFMFDSHFGEFYLMGGMDPRADDFDPTNNVLFKAYFRIDSYEDQEIRQSPQFLALLASWAALYSFFALTFVRVIRLYNKRLYKITDEINNAISKMLHIDRHHSKSENDIYEPEIPMIVLNKDKDNNNNNGKVGGLENSDCIVSSPSVQSSLNKSGNCINLNQIDSINNTTKLNTINNNNNNNNNINNNNNSNSSNNNDYHLEDDIITNPSLNNNNSVININSLKNNNNNNISNFNVIEKEQSKGNLEISWDLHHGTINSNYNISLNSLDGDNTNINNSNSNNNNYSDSNNNNNLNNNNYNNNNSDNLNNGNSIYEKDKKD
ncbi:hypothetical protein ACTFIU_009454 [Dictyostelium citrinum]